MWWCFPSIFCDVCLVSCIFLTVADLCGMEKRDAAEEDKLEEAITFLRSNYA